MLNIKSKLISAAMGISILASTGVALIVHASPINGSYVNTRTQVTYRQYYESFKTQLDRMVSARVINNYQESRVLDVYNSGGNFKAGLDNLVARGVVSGYQETRILDAFNNSPKSNNPVQTKVQGLAPAQQIAPVSNPNHR